MRLTDLLKMAPAIGSVLGTVGGAIGGGLLGGPPGAIGGAQLGGAIGGGLGGVAGQAGQTMEQDEMQKRQAKALQQQAAEQVLMNRQAEDMAREQVIQDLLGNFLRGR